MKATLKIYEPIDSYGWQLYRVRSFLASHTKDEVTIEVNSLGGSVNDAMMISKEIADHGNVTIRLLAFCASAVTWMGFGAKRVEIADDALWLCHQVSVSVNIYASLNADELEQTIKDLQKSKKLAEATDLIIARKYLEKATANGKETTLAKVLDLMREEKYLTATEVLDLGFVDAIVKGAKSMSNEVRNFVAQNHVQLNMPALPEPALQEEEGLMEKVRNIVTEIFGGKLPEKTDTPEKEETDPNNQPQNNQKTMKKNFVLVNALLAISALEVNDDGKIALTEEQLQTIEDALAAKKVADDAVREATEALDSISENVKSIDGLKNKIMAVKTVLDRTPLMAPAGSAQLQETEEQKKAKELAESAQDEINNEAKNI